MASVAPGKRIAGYTVLAEIGKGAASDIYVVQDPRTKQVWALKQVHRITDKDQRFLDQCEDEYQIGSKLDHPAIRHPIKLIKQRHYFRVTDYVLLMEHVDGVPLDHRPPRNMVEAVDIFRQTAEGLNHMHVRGFVHADMKPSNILVTDNRHVKIIDLGQSCPIGTIKKRIQGTPGYMAPEQAHRREITPRTDIYNFGATMYWVLLRDVIPTAMPPKGKNKGSDSTNTSLVGGALDESQIERPVPPHEKNPRIHPILSKLILDCVEVEKERRPESMAEVVQRLSIIHDLLAHPAAETEPSRTANAGANGRSR
jgi:serine/threonine protein kinase